jgi:hypothetical protein
VTRFRGARHFGVRHPACAIYLRSQVALANPLKQDYYSQVPFRLGDYAVKYKVTLTSDVRDQSPDKDPDFLRKVLAKHFEENAATLDFMVQLQTNPVTMPVEDATVIWPEDGPEGCPFVKVATITIPRQVVGNCERLAFNPWHALPEHRPLGVINRIRGEIYAGAAAIRLKVKTQDLFTVIMTLKDPVEGLQRLGKILQDNGLVNAFALNRLGFVHFARFLILQDDFGGKKVTRFLIATTFDFDFSDYVQVFINELGELFDQLLELMEGAPPTPVKQNREAFIEYVNSIRMEPALFFAAYPDLSVQNILKMERGDA